MPRNKLRLSVALYPSGVPDDEERRYHWALLLGPKSIKKPGTGTKHHVINRPAQGWTYVADSVADVRCEMPLLVRVVIAKVVDKERLLEVFRTTPCIQGNPDWRCKSWIHEVLDRIWQDGTIVGSSVLEWDTVEKTTQNYAGLKSAKGRYTNHFDMLAPKPTWDLIQGTEIIP